MFYIIEKKEQLERLKQLDDCFIDFIQNSNNFHPALSGISLIYIRSLKQRKGYIICLNHNESFSLDKQLVFDWLLKNTNKLFVLDKKKTLYHFPHPDKLYDINFIKHIDLSQINITAINYYYKTHSNYPEISRLIPISKHYEEKELTFQIILPVIESFSADSSIYAFNNGPLTQVFYEIERQGICIDKQLFIDCYSKSLKNPEFNISKGRIYSHYNLYTIIGRPSNSFNNINFAALNKNNGERLCYCPSNDKFVEFDIQGYHPRLIGELIGFEFPKNENTYEYLAPLLNVTKEEAKELTFKQLYGGIWPEYQYKPFFKEVAKYMDEIWETFQFGRYYETKNKRFIPDISGMSQPKLLNYVIQSTETSKNVEILLNILDYLKDKQTKLVLYTYDAFLFDYAEDDGKQLLMDIKEIIQYPINIKYGKNYHGLKKL